MTQQTSDKKQTQFSKTLQEIAISLQRGLIEQAALLLQAAYQQDSEVFKKLIKQTFSARVLESLECLADSKDTSNKRSYAIGMLYLECGYPLEAERALRQTISTENSSENKKIYATALARLGRLKDALALFDQILSVTPADGDVWFERGQLLLTVGEIKAAEQSFVKTCQLMPKNSAAWLELGNVKKILQQNEEALQAFTQAINCAPNLPEAFNNRGTIHKLLGNREEALADFTEAIRLNPQHLYAYLNRGALLLELKRLDFAQLDFERALVIAPQDSNAFHGLGEAFQQQGNYDASLINLDSAILLDNTKPVYHLSRGNCLQAMGDFELAIEAYKNALGVDPSFAEAYINWGTVLQELGRHEDAIEVLNKAIELRPNFYGAYWNKANSMLCMGLSKEAWKTYELRHKVKSPDSRKVPNLPLLEDTVPNGKKLLLQWDQRFGDIIQVLRYIPAIEKLASECIWQIAPEMLSLVQASFPDIRIVEPGLEDYGMEYQLPITSLPFVLKTFSETDIPVNVPYLSPSELVLEKWAATMPDKFPRVGLVWRGQPSPPGRSIPLAQLQSLVKIPNISFCSLQYQATPAEIVALTRHGVQHFGEVIKTFEDTAAIIRCMDLVVTVDTSVAHLAGALGIPCFVLLKFGGDWRWHLKGIDSAWYPSARIYRQTSPGDWNAVIENVIADMLVQFESY